MREPVDHILRPQLPWRDDQPQTECGFNAASVPTISREDYAKRLKELGRQRTAMMTCMTCAETSTRHGTWEDDPRRALSREIEWECGRRHDGRGTRLKDELIAIAALVERHRQEFDNSLAEINQRREWESQKKAWIDKKSAHAAKSKKPPGATL